MIFGHKGLSGLPVIIGLAVFWGYGRVIAINIKDSVIIDEKSFLRVTYAQKTNVLKHIGRESGEGKTDPHKIFAEKQNGERIVLFQATRYKVVDKWEEIIEHIPEQLLKEDKGDEDKGD